MEELELDNGHTVRLSKSYEMNFDNKQLGIPKGTEITVERIFSSPGGIHIKFVYKEHEDDDEFATDEIMAYAWNNLLNDGYLKPLS